MPYVDGFVVYRSRAHRDRANARVMKDPRLAATMGGKAMPFDMKRMLYGGGGRWWISRRARRTDPG